MPTTELQAGLLFNCKPYRTFHYREVTRNYGEVIDITGTFSRRSGILNVSVGGTPLPTIHGSAFENGGIVGVSHYEALINTETTTSWLYSDPSVDFGPPGVVTAEYLDEYTPAQQYADLKALQDSLNIDTDIPFPPTRLIRIVPMAYDELGNPTSSLTPLFHSLDAGGAGVPTNLSATVNIKQLWTMGAIGGGPNVEFLKASASGQAFMPSFWGLPQTTLFENIVGVRGDRTLPYANSNIPPGNYPQFTTQMIDSNFFGVLSPGITIGYFAGGFYSYTDFKVGASNTYNLTSTWFPMMARSRFQTSGDMNILRADWTRDPRLGSCFLPRPNDTPYPGDYTAYGAQIDAGNLGPTVSFKRFSPVNGKISINSYPPAANGDTQQVIFLPIFDTLTAPAWQRSLPKPAGGTWYHQTDPVNPSDFSLP